MTGSSISTRAQAAKETGRQHLECRKRIQVSVLQPCTTGIVILFITNDLNILELFFSKLEKMSPDMPAPSTATRSLFRVP